jgi:phosphohistidine phosphatase SixA
MNLKYFICMAMLAMTCMSNATTLTASQTLAQWPAMADGTLVLFRHANAPGGGDPSGFKLRDCSTQRNLDAEGRQQARRIGAAFRERSIAVGAVLTSQWCRARETANLAFPGLASEAAAFNSFFDQMDKSPVQTAQAMAQLGQWQGPGVLVVVTHQVNIRALTGVSPASAEGVVVSITGNEVRVLGRIRP